MGVVNHLGPSISSPCWRCHDFLDQNHVTNWGLAVHFFFQLGRVDYSNQLGLSLLGLKMFQRACNVDGKESCGYDECLLITSVLLCQENNYRLGIPLLCLFILDIMGSRTSFSASQQLLSILSDLPLTRKTEKNVYFSILPMIVC